MNIFISLSYVLVFVFPSYVFACLGAVLLYAWAQISDCSRRACLCLGRELSESCLKLKLRLAKRHIPPNFWGFGFRGPAYFLGFYHRNESFGGFNPETSPKYAHGSVEFLSQEFYFLDIIYLCILTESGA